MIVDDIVLFATNPRQIGIIRETGDKQFFVQWRNGSAWMKAHEVVLERNYRLLHPAYLEPRNKPLYDIFEDDDPTPQTITETVMTVPAQAPQPNEQDEKRRAELENMTVPQLKEYFQHHGPHWRKFANSARKQELVEQLLAWEV